ncbi:hypothetical protein [Ornithinimicrobium sp. INDO-MA30-4]|uniref:hypothetical protein n=1 Tax=Ornithinimicrobium sp. INDO-MA30-4 TaxID=2908651 RepID=UPI001F34194E|nr:hypothetical protein [Ornithinimicrobium sp. INDO-MA30-4]UJH70164.1 hypothetical protein L0A91_13360 [Ornithinimicrobium sp. INDO-MA30-4]
MLHHAGHGDLQVRPDVDRFEETGVRFKDGSFTEYDLIVLATGYRLHYPSSTGLTSTGVANRLTSISISSRRTLRTSSFWGCWSRRGLAGRAGMRRLSCSLPTSRRARLTPKPLPRSRPSLLVRDLTSRVATTTWRWSGCRITSTSTPMSRCSPRSCRR